jgi:hypothetical protein
MSDDAFRIEAALMKILWLSPYDSEIYLLAQDALNRMPNALIAQHELCSTPSEDT